MTPSGGGRRRLLVHEWTRPLSSGDAPRLHTLVRDTAAWVGAAVPTAIELSAGVTLEMTAMQELRWPRRYRLRIGLALLAVVSEDEVRALLEHVLLEARRDSLDPRRWVARFRLPRVAREHVAPGGPAHVAAAARAAFAAYWTSEVAPVLELGMRPPILDGFRRYLRGRGDARIGAGAENLLGDLDAVESALAAAVADATTPVPWDAAVERVRPAIWSHLVAAYRERLTGITPRSLSACAADPAVLPLALGFAREAAHVTDAQRAAAADIVGAALALALHARGWVLHAPPGGEVTLTQDGASFRPFRAVADLAGGTLLPPSWQQLCVFAGIGDVDLAWPERAAEIKRPQHERRRVQRMGA